MDMYTTPGPVDGGRVPIQLLVFSASLRQDSLNTKLAQLAVRVVEQNGGTVDFAEMAEFCTPSYNQDDQDADGFPSGAEALRKRLMANDAFMIASPEYNASIPGYLKNSIDWVSRFRPQPFNKKHCLLLSASPSMVGGNRGLWALRIPLEHLGARVYPDMFSLAQAHKAFGPHGDLLDQQLTQRLELTIISFLDLVEATKHYPAVKQAWFEFLGEIPDGATDRRE